MTRSLSENCFFCNFDLAILTEILMSNKITNYFAMVSNTLFTGKILFSLEQTTSTNAWLQAYVSVHEAVEGTAVIAAYQTAGKGQQHNRWQSEAGSNLLCSLLLKPDFMPVASLFFLNKAIALAVSDTVALFTEKPVWIKWPNDILIDGDKVAGILIESSIQGSRVNSCIAGVGVNVNQRRSEGLPKATSLAIAGGAELQTEAVFSALCVHIEKYYLRLREKRYAAIDRLYHERLYRLNRPAPFAVGENVFEGVITGVTPEGKLCVWAEGLEQYFGIKEIAFL